MKSLASFLRCIIKEFIEIIVHEYLFFSVYDLLKTSQAIILETSGKKENQGSYYYFTQENINLYICVAEQMHVNVYEE